MAFTAIGGVSVTDVRDGENGAPGAPGTPGSNGDDGDNSRTVYLFRNGTTTPPSPGTSATAGFNTSGAAVAVNGWATSATVPPAGQTIFVASRNIRQPNGTGNWVQDGAWQVNPAAASGTNGTNGDDGDDGAPGANGSDAPRFAEATLYTNPAVATAPSAPSATITWSTGALSSITTGWSQTPPTQIASSTDVIYSSQLVFIDTTAPFTTTTDTGTTPVQGTSFGGLVSFTGGDFAIGGSTITNIDGGNITTDSIKANSLDIDGTLTMDAPTSAFIAGRTGASDFGTDGYFVGRTSTDGISADGFQLSHTSVASGAIVTDGTNVASGTVQGVIHDDTQGLRIYEPVFYERGVNTGADALLDAQGETATLTAGEIHYVTVWGGGAGGGGASNSGGGAGTAGTAGGSSTIQLSGASGFTGTRNYTASGGTAGAAGSGFNVGGPGGTGGETAFGQGGNGGAAGAIVNEQINGGGNGSSPAATAFGAGGGGGGAGSHANRNAVGNPGEGGGAAQPLSVVYDLTNATTNGTLTLTTRGAAGTGGAGASGNDDAAAGGAGAAGRPGVASVSGVLDGYTSRTLADLGGSIASPFTVAATGTGFLNNNTASITTTGGAGVYAIANLVNGSNGNNVHAPTLATTNVLDGFYGGQIIDAGVSTGGQPRSADGNVSLAVTGVVRSSGNITFNRLQGGNASVTVRWALLAGA